MRRISLGFFCVVLGCGGGVAPDAVPVTGDAGIDAPAAVPQSLVLTGVDAYQVVQIPLIKDGARIGTRNAPLIADRDALIRVAVKPDAGWKRKRVDATLTLTNSKGTTDKRIPLEIGPSGSITGAYESTFNFDVPKEQLTKDATWSVTIKVGEEQLARFPEEGSDALGAVASGVLKVKLVPVKWDADGSGRVPDISSDMRDLYRANLMSLYPVKDVEISVRDPYAWSETVTAGGDGWESLLTAIVDLRNSESAESDVYYYGIFNPTASFYKYCDRGCVAGLSGVNRDPTDAFGRGSIGLGYSDESSAKTMAHEIGHAHGRFHAPCGDVRGPDKKFPYSDGSIGVYGWNQTEKTLIDATYSDVMGYCYPIWISDYTYKALYERIAYVSKPKDIVKLAIAPIRYRFIQVDRAGKLHWGRTTITRNAPTSDPHTVTYEAADGSTQSVTGHYYPYGDEEGGYLVVPEPTIPAVKVAVDAMPAGIQRILPLPK